MKMGLLRSDPEDTQKDFLYTIGNILPESKTGCCALALPPNHAHILLQTGLVSIGTIMRRLLTGYARGYNHRHYRHGQLFQNRYKSIPCQEDAYLLELVRCIHLNLLTQGTVRAEVQIEVPGFYPLHPFEKGF